MRLDYDRRPRPARVGTERDLVVEILDVTRDEVRKLLLNMGPLAALAGQDEAAFQELRWSTTTDSPILTQLSQSLSTEAGAAWAQAEGVSDEQETAEQFLVLITCKSEKHPEQVLAECQKRDWKCKPTDGVPAPPPELEREARFSSKSEKRRRGCRRIGPA
jgi:hypothetical protein